MAGHRVTTDGRGRGYFALCECGEITFGGFPTRTAAREALRGHENALAGTGATAGVGNDPTTQVRTGSEISPIMTDTTALVDPTPAFPAPVDHPTPAWATSVTPWESDAGKAWMRGCKVTSGPVQLAQEQVARPEGVRDESAEVFIPEQLIVGDPRQILDGLAQFAADVAAVRVALRESVLVPQDAAGSERERRLAERTLPFWADRAGLPFDDGACREVSRAISAHVEVGSVQRADGTSERPELDVAAYCSSDLVSAIEFARSVALGVAQLAAAQQLPEPLSGTSVVERDLVGPRTVASAVAVAIDGDGYVDVTVEEPLTPASARALAASLVLAADRAESPAHEA